MLKAEYFKASFLNLKVVCKKGRKSWLFYILSSHKLNSPYGWEDRNRSLQSQDMWFEKFTLN